jgi:serine/threonine protein phosphatase 1
VLITLGDYVDRGPDSRGVIERLLKLRKKHCIYALRGNHDQMMLDARHSLVVRDEWLFFGGKATLASYGHDSPSASRAPAEGQTDFSSLGGTLDDVPVTHWTFLEETILYHEIDTHFFVHATALPDLPLSEQSEHALMWQKLVHPEPHVSGKIMVCGHTAQKIGLPLNLGHTICIDTFVYGDGWLTCLDVRSGWVWQANERGDSRRFRVVDEDQ